MANTTQDIDQNQIETSLLTEVDIHFLLTKKIEAILMKQAEFTQQIVDATAQIKANNENIKAEFAALSNANATSDDVSAEQEQALNDLKAAEQDQADILASLATGNTGSGDTTVPPVVDTTVPPTTDGTDVVPGI